MVIQKAVNNLKDKPKDDKKVVAGGIAIAVVAVLFFGWTILFLKKLQRGEQELQFGSGEQQEFLGSAVREAQDQLLNVSTEIDELRAIREQIGSQNQQSIVQPSYEDLGDPFRQ